MLCCLAHACALEAVMTAGLILALSTALFCEATAKRTAGLADAKGTWTASKCSVFQSLKEIIVYCPGTLQKLGRDRGLLL